MNIKTVITTIAAVLAMMVPVMAGTSDTNDKVLAADAVQKQSVVSLIDRHYSDWESCALSGKIKAAGLPVSPSLKIFMSAGQGMSVSLRVPFLGEVGRAEIDLDSVTLVNKMKKVYTRISVRESRITPELLSEAQNFLLGRIVVAGHGLLDSSTAPLVDIYSDDGGYIIIPADSVQPEGMAYGFRTDRQGVLRTVMASAGSVDSPDTGTSVVLEYTYPGSSTQIECVISGVKDKSDVRISLELGEPDYSARPIEVFRPGKSYRFVGIKEFMKSF